MNFNIFKWFRRYQEETKEAKQYPVFMDITTVDKKTLHKFFWPSIYREAYNKVDLCRPKDCNPILLLLHHLQSSDRVIYHILDFYEVEAWFETKKFGWCRLNFHCGYEGIDGGPLGIGQVEFFVPIAKQWYHIDKHKMFEDCIKTGDEKCVVGNTYTLVNWLGEVFYPLIEEYSNTRGL